VAETPGSIDQGLVSTSNSTSNDAQITAPSPKWVKVSAGHSSQNQSKNTRKYFATLSNFLIASASPSGAVATGEDGKFSTDSRNTYLFTSLLFL